MSLISIFLSFVVGTSLYFSDVPLEIKQSYDYNKEVMIEMDTLKEDTIKDLYVFLKVIDNEAKESELKKNLLIKHFNIDVKGILTNLKNTNNKETLDTYVLDYLYTKQKFIDSYSKDLNSSRPQIVEGK